MCAFCYVYAYWENMIGYSFLHAQLNSHVTYMYGKLHAVSYTGVLSM